VASLAQLPSFCGHPVSSRTLGLVDFQMRVQKSSCDMLMGSAVNNIAVNGSALKVLAVTSARASRRKGARGLPLHTFTLIFPSKHSTKRGHAILTTRSNRHVEAAIMLSALSFD